MKYQYTIWAPKDHHTTGKPLKSLRQLYEDYETIDIKTVECRDEDEFKFYVFSDPDITEGCYVHHTRWLQITSCSMDDFVFIL